MKHRADRVKLSSCDEYDSRSLTGFDNRPAAGKLCAVIQRFEVLECGPIKVLMDSAERRKGYNYLLKEDCHVASSAARGMYALSATVPSVITFL